MSDNTTTSGLAAVAAAANAVSRADHEKALAAANTAAENLLTEGVAKAHAEGVKEGAAAARTRIKTILGSEEAKGRDALAQHFAFDTEMPADAALAALKVAPKADAAKTGASGRLDVAMQGIRPKVDTLDNAAASPADELAANMTVQIARMTSGKAA
jgi:hypothetical protein